MTSRAHSLDAELRELEQKLEQGGGAKKIEKLHSQGKLSARERVDLLRDKGSAFLEIGLLVAYDEYDGQAPARRRRNRPRRCRWARSRRGRQRPDGQGRLLVAGDDQEDSARAGDRHALHDPDRVSRRFGRREPAVSGRSFPRPVRREPHLLLQLGNAQILCAFRRSRR